MNHRHIIFYILSLIPLSGFAQYVLEEDSVATGKKNAVGLYINTPVTGLMGAFPGSPRLGIVYKRAGKLNRTMRIQVVADITDLYDDDGVLSTITRLTDTTMNYLYESDKDVLTTIRFGYEWSNPKRAVSAVYGADVIAGLRAYSYEKSYITFFQDTSATTIQPDSHRKTTERKVEDYDQTSYYFGFDFTVGCRVNIGEKCSLVAQFSPEILFTPFQNVRYNLTPHPPVSTNYFLTDFRLRVIEMQLFYRF